jgi:hypothetical protein
MRDNSLVYESGGLPWPPHLASRTAIGLPEMGIPLAGTLSLAILARRLSRAYRTTLVVIIAVGVATAAAGMLFLYCRR